jgi:hypothetical protein
MSLASDSFGSFDLCFFSLLFDSSESFPFLSHVPLASLSFPFGGTTTRNLIHHSTNPRTETLDNRSTMLARPPTSPTANSKVDIDWVAILWRPIETSQLIPKKPSVRIS